MIEKNDIHFILVTGGAGFIGSNFLNLFVPQHPEIVFINADALTYAANLKNIKISKNPNYFFYHADICDEKIMDGIFRKHRLDAVINFAAESHVDNSIKLSNEFIRTNIIGAKTLLDLSVKYRIKRFHQISTDEVYGDAKSGKFTEESPLRPNNPYSATKAAADLLVHVYDRTFGLNTVITRGSNNFGPHQHHEKFIPTVIRNILSRQKIPVYGTGQNIRDWIFVEDHCVGVWEAFWQGRRDHIYNLGGSNEWKNIEIVKLILKKIDASEELIKFVTDRPGHDLRYALDSTKAKKELGWAPEHDFDAGIDKTIEYYKKKYGREEIK